MTDIEKYYVSGDSQGFTDEQIEQLEQPLDASLIRQRPDGKKYLKGATEFDAANRIFGYGKWGYRVLSRTLQKSYDLEDKVTGLYFYVEVELYVAGAMFPFYGDGGQSVKYYTAQGYEDASKGATTDAVKRALRHYGDQMGLCLYDEDALVDTGEGTLTKVKEVKVNPNGKQKQIVDSRPNQRQLPPAQDQRQPAALEDIPTMPAIRTKFASVKPKHPQTHKELSWQDFLRLVFTKQIEAKKLTVEKLEQAGDELPPQYCAAIAMALHKLTEQAA